MLFDLHTHTIASTHAYSTLLENIECAKKAGLKIMGTSDHAPEMPMTTSIAHFYNQRVVPREVSGVKILRGIEANILDKDGTVDIPFDARCPDLDYAIASLHTIVYYSEDREEITNAYIKAMDHPLVKIIGHPEDARYNKDFDRIAKAATEKGVALELNESSLSPNGFRQNGKEAMKELILACLRNDTMMIIGTDAHFATAVGNFERVRSLLEEMGVPENRVLNNDEKKLWELLGFEI